MKNIMGSAPNAAATISGKLPRSSTSSSTICMTGGIPIPHTIREAREEASPTVVRETLWAREEASLTEVREILWAREEVSLTVVRETLWAREEASLTEVREIPWAREEAGPTDILPGGTGASREILSYGR